MPFVYCLINQDKRPSQARTDQKGLGGGHEFANSLGIMKLPVGRDFEFDPNDRYRVSAWISNNDIGKDEIEIRVVGVEIMVMGDIAIEDWDE